MQKHIQTIGLPKLNCINLQCRVHIIWSWQEISTQIHRAPLGEQHPPLAVEQQVIDVSKSNLKVAV